ncbi:MAG: hypothetical protein ABIH34_00635 [Nanoarchaeota archaeon]
MFFKLFRKKTEPIVLVEKEIPGWLAEKRKKADADLESFIEEKLDMITQKKGAIQEQKEILRNAQLKNKKIPDRAMHTMEGSRTFYLTRVEQFLATMSLPREKEALEEACSQFHDQLLVFGKATARSFYILQEFFANESGRIAAAIKVIDLTVSAIEEELRSASSVKINSLQEKAALLQKSKQARTALTASLKRMESTLENVDGDIKKLLKEKEGIEKSKGMERYHLQEKEKIQKEHEFGNAKRAIIDQFQALEAALKKYERMTLFPEIIRPYTADPIAGLLKDEELSIIPELDKMKDVIDKDSLQLKDKKREKALHALDTCTAERLNSLRKEHDHSHKEMLVSSKALDDNKDKKAIDAINKELKNKQDERKALESKINEKKREIDEIKPELIIKELQSDIEKLFRLEMSIEPS